MLKPIFLSLFLVANFALAQETKGKPSSPEQGLQQSQILNQGLEVDPFSIFVENNKNSLAKKFHDKFEIKKLDVDGDDAIIIKFHKSHSDIVSEAIFSSRHQGKMLKIHFTGVEMDNKGKPYINPEMENPQSLFETSDNTIEFSMISFQQKDIKPVSGSNHKFKFNSVTRRVETDEQIILLNQFREHEENANKTLRVNMTALKNLELYSDLALEHIFTIVDPE